MEQLSFLKKMLTIKNINSTGWMKRKIDSIISIQKRIKRSIKEVIHQLAQSKMNH